MCIAALGYVMHSGDSCNLCSPDIVNFFFYRLFFNCDDCTTRVLAIVCFGSLTEF